MYVMSWLHDEAGRGQTHNNAMACKDGSIWGGRAIVDQSKVFTAGNKDSSKDRSVLSWRAAVIIIVQKRSGDTSYRASAEGGGVRIGIDE